MEDLVDLELMANRFNRLVKELVQGEVLRTCFQPWEVDFLVDLQACRMTRSRRVEALHRYQRAVQRQLEHGEFPPVRFSEFLTHRTRKAAPVPPASLGTQDSPPLNP